MCIRAVYAFMSIEFDCSACFPENGLLIIVFYRKIGTGTTKTSCADM